MPYQSIRSVRPAYGVFLVALALVVTLGQAAQVTSAPLGLAVAEFLFATWGARWEPSPLATAGLPTGRLVKLTGTAFTAVVVTVVLAFGPALKSYRMTNDALAPEIQRDQLVLVARTGVRSLSINTGDVVAYRRNDRAYLRRVVVANGEHVEVKDDGDRLAIPNRQRGGQDDLCGGWGKTTNQSIAAEA